MLQIEQANTRGQFKEVLDKKAIYERINPALTSPVIVNGSLIKTNKGWFFLSVAAGKAIVEGNAIIALSPQSPLGMKLMGLKVGESLKVNNIQYIIEAIN